MTDAQPDKQTVEWHALGARIYTSDAQLVSTCSSPDLAEKLAERHNERLADA